MPGSGRVAAMILLFGQTRIRFYYLGENEKMILLFLIGREYDFTERGGTGLISSDAAFFCFTFYIIPTDARSVSDLLLTERGQTGVFFRYLITVKVPRKRH